MTRVLVTGGTGTLGRSVTRRLLDSGYDVRVLSRRAASAGAASADHDPSRTSSELTVGDLRTGAGLATALDGVDAVVHCASDPRHAGVVDVEGTSRLIDAARATGRDPHLVYVSIVGVDRVPLRYYRAKLATEQLVTDSGLPFTVQRATQFHDLVATMAKAAARGPVLLAPRGFAFQPVDLGDVADRLVAQVAQGPTGRAPDLGGPQPQPFADLAQAWSLASGRRRRVVELPLPGRFARSLRAGENLCPDHADGTLSFEDWLAQSFSTGA